MKVVILAGGLGTRLSEETDIRPKPMVEIGGQPILWHIMKIYSHYGFNDFIICLGYKGQVIKDFFINYLNNNSSIRVNLNDNKIDVYTTINEKWNIELIDTGESTMTGGRIKKIEHLINEDNFFLTYGDGVSDVNIPSLLDFHIKNNRLCTVTAVKPNARFGVLNINHDNIVTKFSEKRDEDVNWINGGYFVCNKGVFKYIKYNNDNEVWEATPLENLAIDNELVAYKHEGFWRPMDSLKDKKDLNDLWNNNNAKWKIW
jgi:glucose-1-phosphate cytidylyltransferase